MLRQRRVELADEVMQVLQRYTGLGGDIGHGVAPVVEERRTVVRSPVGQRSPHAENRSEFGCQRRTRLWAVSSSWSNRARDGRVSS